MKKIIVFLLLILFPVSAWAEDDVPAELDTLNRYEKTSIEQVTFEKEDRELKGYSTPGALISIDFGESVKVPASGEFNFEVPKDIQMVIINASNQEGLEPNSIMFDLAKNRILSDGEETPPPNAPNIKEKKQEKKENQKPKEEGNKEKKKEISNTEKKEEPSSTEKKDHTTISQKKTIQTERTDSSMEEVPNQTNSNENFWRWVKISLFLLLIIAVVAVILSGKLIKVKTSKKKKKKRHLKKRKRANERKERTFNN